MWDWPFTYECHGLHLLRWFDKDETPATIWFRSPEVVPDLKKELDEIRRIGTPAGHRSKVLYCRGTDKSKNLDEKGEKLE